MPHTAKQQRVYRYERDVKRAVAEHHEGMQPYMHQCYMNKNPALLWFSDLMNMDDETLEVLALSIKRAKQLRRRRDALESDSESDSEHDTQLVQPTIIQRRDVQRANRSQAMIKSHEQRQDKHLPHCLNQLSHDYDTMFDKHVDVPSRPPYDLSHDLDEVMRDFTAIFGA